MKGKDLALALGISEAMVSKLRKRGMPTDSVERAVRWRRRHLEPGRVRGVRADRPRVQTPAVGEGDRSRLDLVAQLADLAAADFARWEPQLRTALRAVPVAARPLVGMPAEVWQQLTEYGHAVLTPVIDEAPPGVGDAEAQAITEAFVYALAAGEFELQGGRLVAVTPAAAAAVRAIGRLPHQ
jgi:hypothetical protein